MAGRALTAAGLAAVILALARVHRVVAATWADINELGRDPFLFRQPRR